jgi:hypothetical protein
MNNIGVVSMKWFRLMMLILALLCLTACNSENPQDSSTENSLPSIASESPAPSETEPAVSSSGSIKTEPDTDYELPVLLGIEGSESDTISVYHVFWDTKSGAFSDPAEWYQIKNNQKLWDEKTYWWNGSTRVVTYGEPMTVAAGLDVTQKNYSGSSEFGSTEYITSGESNSKVNSFPYLQYTDQNGDITAIEFPDLVVPDELTTESISTESPLYVGIFDNRIIVVFMAYHSVEMDGDLYYAKCEIGSTEEQIDWGHAYIPWEYAVDVYMNGNIFSDGTYLYAAGWDEIVTVDLAAGSVSTLGAFDEFIEEHPNYGNESGMSETPVLAMDPIAIDGFWHDICVIRYDFWDKAGAEHLYYLAVRDNQVLGVMERSNGRFTFYDGSLNELGQNSDYEGALKNSGLNFARE